MVAISAALDPAREAALLVRARGTSSAQREEAFNEVFEAFRKPVLALCLHLTGSRSEAEDAAQDVFLVVFKGLAKFRGESRVSTWIYRITIRAAFRMKARRPKTEPLVVDPPGPASDPALDREKGRQLRISSRSMDSRTWKSRRRSASRKGRSGHDCISRARSSPPSSVPLGIDWRKR